MIESYSATITQIDDLGGGDETVTSSMLVCDRCGFRKSHNEMTIEQHTGYEVCFPCLDKEGPKPRD